MAWKFQLIRGELCIGSEDDKCDLVAKTNFAIRYTQDIASSQKKIDEYKPISIDPWVESDAFIEAKTLMAGVNCSNPDPFEDPIIGTSNNSSPFATISENIINTSVDIF